MKYSESFTKHYLRFSYLWQEGMKHKRRRLSGLLLGCMDCSVDYRCNGCTGSLPCPCQTCSYRTCAARVRTFHIQFGDRCPVRKSRHSGYRWQSWLRWWAFWSCLESLMRPNIFPSLSLLFSVLDLVTVRLFFWPLVWTVTKDHSVKIKKRWTALNFDVVVTCKVLNYVWQNILRPTAFSENSITIWHDSVTRHLRNGRHQSLTLHHISEANLTLVLEDLLYITPNLLVTSYGFSTWKS